MSLFTPQHQPLTLRPYQREAIDAVYRHLREYDDNPCVVIPTGGGKTPVMASICSDAVGLWHGRVLIVAHVKELLEQAHDKLSQVCPDIPIGVYSAGLKRRDTDTPVLIAGIQSVHQKAEQIGRFDLVLVDEAHLIPPDGDGMYRRFIADAKRINPELRIVGLTATPFRMQSGAICQPAPDGILNAVCYEAGVRELIRDGFLCPLKSKAGRQKVDTSKLHQRGGEFVANEVEELMDQDGLVRAACAEIVEQVKAGNRKAVLIFASGVSHGRHVAKAIEAAPGIGGAGEECGFVDGDTPDLHRDALIRRFCAGELRYLCNVNVLTTGFDAPNVDCVVLLRPTMSPGLYYQMVGRGFRLHPGKADCLVLDFGGNVMRHGPVDQIRVGDPSKRRGEAPVKECPQCQALVATGCALCPECGHAFSPPEKKVHDVEASDAGVLAGQVTVREYAVRRIHYSVHSKRDAHPGAPKTLRVDYEIGFHQYQSEWVCVEHPLGSYAQQKARDWWRLRSTTPMPDLAEDAAAMANAGVLAPALAITVRSVAGEKYDRITACELGTKPDWENLNAATSNRAEPELQIAEDDIPF